MDELLLVATFVLLARPIAASTIHTTGAIESVSAITIATDVTVSALRTWWPAVRLGMPAMSHAAQIEAMAQHQEARNAVPSYCPVAQARTARTARMSAVCAAKPLVWRNMPLINLDGPQNNLSH